MKLHPSIRPLLLVSLGLIPWVCPAAPNKPAPAPPVEAPPPPKSAFVNDPTTGKDPFYPKSTRRPLIAATTTPDSVAVQQPFISDKIILQGLSGTKEKRLAIINNRTFEPGEEVDLRVDGLIQRVRLVEIRDRSVLIGVKGMTKELQMRRPL